MTIWRAASGAPGKTRNWFVIRWLDGQGVTGEVAETANGSRRFFATYEQAKKAANQLNSAFVKMHHNDSAVN